MKYMRLFVSGVPQGTVLDPLLFLILMHDIHAGISDDVSFDDDTRVYQTVICCSWTHLNGPVMSHQSLVSFSSISYISIRIVTRICLKHVFSNHLIYASNVGKRLNISHTLIYHLC